MTSVQVMLLYLCGAVCFGQSDSLETKELVVYFINGKVETFNVLELEIPEKTSRLYKFSFPNPALSKPLSETKYAYYMTRPQKKGISGKKIHSIQYEGLTTEVSGSNDVGMNLALCMDRYRKQRNSGFVVGLLGGGITLIGAIVGIDDGGALAIAGVMTTLVGTIITLDSNKWLNKSRTIPKVR